MELCSEEIDEQRNSKSSLDFRRHPHSDSLTFSGEWGKLSKLSNIQTSKTSNIQTSNRHGVGPPVQPFGNRLNNRTTRNHDYNTTSAPLASPWALPAGQPPRTPSTSWPLRSPPPGASVPMSSPARCARSRRYRGSALWRVPASRRRSPRSPTTNTRHLCRDGLTTQKP